MKFHFVYATSLLRLTTPQEDHQLSPDGVWRKDRLLVYDLPVFTCSTIINRTETHQDISHTPSAFDIIKNIDQMESDLSMVKQSVISKMEKRIQDLKFSILDMFARIKSNRT